MNSNNVIHESAQLNEAIKQVVRLSRRVYLGSLNAMFTARTAGGTALGFVRVTSQLRSFSDQLSHAMRQLQADVERLVEQAADYQRGRHSGELADAALSQIQQDSIAIAAFRRRIRHKQQQRAAQLRECQTRVGRAMHAAQRLCQIGASLAVLGKIEAGSSHGEAEGRLRSVADEAGQTVEAIEALLKQAQHLLDGHGELAA